MKSIMSKFEQKMHGAFQMVIARKLRACFGAVMALAFLLVSPMASSAGYTLDTSASPSPITGLWWNQNESGWGATLTQQYDVIFVTMFTYDGAGNPTWYVVSNCAVSGGGCQGDLSKVTGGSMQTVTWNGTNIAETSVGTLSLAFTDDNTGAMNYTINGVNGSKEITRQVWRTAPPVVTPPAATGVTFSGNLGGFYSIADTNKYNYNNGAGASVGKTGTNYVYFWNDASGASAAGTYTLTTSSQALVSFITGIANISCGVNSSFSITYPLCSSIGVTFDKAAGRITFASTPFVYYGSNISTGITATGSLSFTPF